MTGEAEASALSRLVLTSAIAALSAATPSCAGLTCVSASSDDLSAATSSQPAFVDAALGVAAVVAGAGVGAGGFVWLGAELVPQLARRQIKATAAAAADADRRALWSRIWVFS